jgi:hypothetical protein
MREIGLPRECAAACRGHGEETGATLDGRPPANIVRARARLNRNEQCEQVEATRVPRVARNKRRLRA